MTGASQGRLDKLASKVEEARARLEEAKRAAERERTAIQSTCTHDFAYFGDSVECRKCGYTEYCG